MNLPFLFFRFVKIFLLENLQLLNLTRFFRDCKKNLNVGGFCSTVILLGQIQKSMKMTFLDKKGRKQ